VAVQEVIWDEGGS